jgi:hypothetical protein
MGCCTERLGRRAAFALLLSFTACATQAAAPPQPARTNTHPERVSQIPLPASGYVYDVAVADGSTWVTTQAGLYEIDPATSEAVDVLPREYLFRVVVGHGAVWISTGSDGHVLRVDPTSKSVTAEIDVREGPVTELAISKDAVWVSATSELVRIDPGTNEVVARLRSERGFGDIGFGEAGLWVIVGANEDGEVWQIDAATGVVLQRIPLANPSFWNEIAVGSTAVWVTSSLTAHRDGTALVHLYRIDPSAGSITADIPVGGGPSGLDPGEVAVSYSALALDEGSMWVLVSFEDRLFSVDPIDLGPREALDGIANGGSDVGPGSTIGAGSIWVTASTTVTRISLGI